MRFKEISETPYSDKITKQIAPRRKLEHPISLTNYPKGPELKHSHQGNNQIKSTLLSF